MDTVEQWVIATKARLAHQTTVTCSVRLTTRASVNCIERIDEQGTVYAKVSAPPHDNEANEALLDVLSDTLDVPRSYVSLYRGRTSRNKLVRITY